VKKNVDMTLGTCDIQRACVLIISKKYNRWKGKRGGGGARRKENAFLCGLV